MSRSGGTYKYDNKLNSRNFDQVLDSIITDTDKNDQTHDLQMEDLGNISPSLQVDNDQNPQNPQNPQYDQMSHKMDVMMLTNGWNDKNERIVISIGENAASYKWMHEKSAAYYKLINQILTVIMIIFSTGLSAETIIPSSDTSLAISILRRIFTYIITLVSVLQSFLKYEKLAERHLSSAVSFGRLYHDIQQQMCMYRRDRHNATMYVTDALKQYDTLIVNGPQISQQTIKKFKDTFKNADISVPDIADRIQKIEIISEPVTTNKNKAITFGVATTQPSKEPNVSTNNNSYGVCNLDQIHNAFQIHGDISDKDIQNADANELKEMRHKYINEMSNYELKRFMQHANERD